MAMRTEKTGHGSNRCENLSHCKVDSSGSKSARESEACNYFAPLLLRFLIGLDNTLVITRLIQIPNCLGVDGGGFDTPVQCLYRVGTVSLDLHSALEDVRQELASSQARLEKLSAYIESLKVEERGLELALSRHNGQLSEETPSVGDAAKWKGMARTDAILAVLTQAEEPMGPAEIARVLHDRGRDDPRDHVAAALAYLKRKGRVDHGDVGEWSVGLEASDEESRLDLEGGDPR